MGFMISRVFDKFFGGAQEECGILMVGLDAAGKTTILYKLKLGEVQNTRPTIGFNVESVKYKNVLFNVWDVGGQSKLRALWRHYYKGVGGVIFVIDSADSDRFGEAQKELAGMLKDELLKDVVVLVLANKQDLPKAASPSEVSDEMGLRTFNQKWKVQGCCGTSGDGLFDGLDWLAAAMPKSAKT